MSYVLAIDQGTQSTRAAVLDMQGRVLSMAAVPVTSTQPKTGWVEQDADQIVQSTLAVIDQVLNEITASIRSSIECCGIATQRSSVLCWNEQGIALSPVLNWQDTRGEAMLAQVNGHADEIKRISGLPLSLHYGATKLHWLMDNYKNNLSGGIGPISSYLQSKLVNADTHAVDHGNAQRMQLLDIQSMDWSERLTDLFGVPTTSLPVTKPIYHNFGEILTHGIPITAMNGDQNAAWFGAGLPNAGTALINIGSGAFILTPRQNTTNIPQLLTSISLSDKTECSYLLEATVNGAGNALQWLAHQFGIKDFRPLLQQALEQTKNPPIFLNTVGGLGSPWWKSGLEPLFHGDTSGYSHAEMLASVCESIIFLVYHNIQLIQQYQSITELQLSGGLSQVDQICQKLANLTELKVVRSNDSERTLRGIARIAAGQPKIWDTDEQDVFVPSNESGLNSRFKLFIELLTKYIEESNYE